MSKLSKHPLTQIGLHILEWVHLKKTLGQT